MAIRYRAYWSDTQGNDYELTVDGVNYTGAESVVTASAEIGFDANDDLFQPIRSSYATINFIASIAQDFSDLWEQPSNYWYAFIYKNGEEIFRGGLDMDEVEQPFSADIWQISVEVRDALGWLEELAFVQDGGTHWEGNDTVISTIAKALRRGYGDSSYALEIIAFTKITHSGNPFEANAYVDQNAFIEENEEDPMNCKDVVEQMVESMGCTIFQHNGKIYIINIYHWYYFFTSPTQLCERYDALGALLESDYVLSTGNSQPQQYVGTHKVNETYSGSDVSIFHVSKSTSYFIRRPVFSSTWFHKYEYRKDILTNGTMTSPDAFPGPYTQPGWTLEAGKATEAQFSILIDGISGNWLELGLTSDAIALREGNTFTMTIDVEFDLDGGPCVNWYSQIKLVAADSSIWYLVGYIGGESIWIEFDAAISEPSEYFYFVNKETTRPYTDSTVDMGDNPFWTYKVDIPALPVDGDFNVAFMRPEFPGTITVNSKVIINEVLLDGTANSKEGIESRCYRTDSEEGRVLDVREVRFATAESLAIKNTFYDSSGVLIEEATSNFGTESTLQMLARWENWNNYETTKDVSGEVVGEIEHYMPKLLLSVGGSYYMSRLGKNTSNDISRVELIGVSPRPIPPVDTDVETNYRYSGEIKAKIKT